VVAGGNVVVTGGNVVVTGGNVVVTGARGNDVATGIGGKLVVDPKKGVAGR
jgi:lipopolysaccharide export system protein LptA